MTLPICPLCLAPPVDVADGGRCVCACGNTWTASRDISAEALRDAHADALAAERRRRAREGHRMSHEMKTRRRRARGRPVTPAELRAHREEKRPMAVKETT